MEGALHDEKAAVLEARPLITVALAGMSLSLINFFALTEFPSLIGSNELVAVAAMTAYFLGMSVGYLVSDRLDHDDLVVLGGVTLVLHATLPFSSRFVVGSLWSLGAQGLVPVFVFLLILFGVSPFFAVFLPRLIDAVATARAASGGQKPHPLGLLYATELGGTVIGVVVVLIARVRMNVVLCLYLAATSALVLLCAGVSRRAFVALVVPLPLMYLLFGPWLDRESLAFYYRARRGFDSRPPDLRGAPDETLQASRMA